MSRFLRERRFAVEPRPAYELIAAGYSKHVLEGPRWRQTSRGFHVPSSTQNTTTQRILQAWTMAPSGAVISGWAAAYALGVDQLDGLNDYTMRARPVTVLTPTHVHRCSTPDVRYRQDLVALQERVSVAGVVVTTALRTAADLARWGPSVTEAVVALDAMVEAGITNPAALSDKASELAGTRGIRQLREAVRRCRTGVRSTWESRLRMVCELDLGWPSLLVNQPVFDHAGRLIGIPDLLDADAGLAIEYDGAVWTGSGVVGGHRDRAQHRADNVREELFERTGLIVVRVAKDDMTRYGPQLDERLTTARLEGLGRNRHKDRWTITRRAA